jgi:putative IMPACT (imprinted ancient) family translation regulator
MLLLQVKHIAPLAALLPCVRTFNPQLLVHTHAHGFYSKAALHASLSTLITVDGEHEAEETVKKSRFVGRCTSAASFDEAKRFIASVSDPKARHNCWGWVGAGGAQRSSDDGEPSGTAGRPILNAIEGEDLSNVVVVVTRHKSKDAPMLGAGGLLRAYGSAANLVLRSADRVSVIPTQVLNLEFPMSELGRAQNLISRYEMRKPGTGALWRCGSEDYGASEVSLSVEIERDHADEFEAELKEATNGLSVVGRDIPSPGE